MRALIAALLGALAVAPGVHAVTLTITPDKAVYSVGEEIVLSVVGTHEGQPTISIHGRILFDDRADYVSSSQVAMTSFGSPWALALLTGGTGFADAFSQICCLGVFPADGPLSASVVLRARSPGTLSVSWQTSSLEFFGLASAPGTSVTIVPEPATALLLGSSLLGLALRRAR